MCKFCHEDWGQRFTVQAKTDGVFSSYGGMQVENGCISVNVGGSVARFPVNCCPVCGRQLEDTPRIPESEYKADDFVAPWDEQKDSNKESSVKSTYTAFLYEVDGETSKDFSTFDEKEDAIKYAKFHEWDEVVEDATGTVVWKI